jgi:hypothetical protein
MTDEWYQVEIRDDSALSGASLVRLLETLLTVVPAQTVAVRGAEGAGPDFASVFPSDRIVPFDIDAFKRVASQVVQFDWGDFLLAKHADELTNIPADAAHEALLPRALATIRAVDDTYFYVYTTDPDTVAVLTRAFPSAKVHTASLDRLDYPD